MIYIIIILVLVTYISHLRSELEYEKQSHQLTVYRLNKQGERCAELSKWLYERD